MQLSAGLDTGCCYGFKLTACVLPPAPKRKLLSRVFAQLKPTKAQVPTGPSAVRAPAQLFVEDPKVTARGVTLQDLGATLLYVESRQTYEKVVKF